MINVLITGKSSYVGNCCERWLSQWQEVYKIKKISLRDGAWQEESFAGYDVILHVAGIAHVNAKAGQEELYDKVNRQLTIAVAEKAKKEGVEQFIFLSSMIVYGESNAKNRDTVITKETKPNPAGFYGNSKLQAEMGILPLQGERFHVAILRPPMIYGRGSKGNFPKLAKLARIIPIFPDVKNQRSMIYVDHLCEFIRLMIENKESGIFHPQNKDHVQTSDLVKCIAEMNHHPMLLTKRFNFFVRILASKINIVNKIFGTFIYAKEISNYKDFTYCKFPFKESIQLTEATNEKSAYDRISRFHD